MALWRSHRFVSAPILSCLCIALGTGLFADGQTPSSAYTSVRDGNRLAIPEQFLSSDYREQPFVHEVRTIAVPKADGASDGASAQPRMPAK